MGRWMDEENFKGEIPVFLEMEDGAPTQAAGFFLSICFFVSSCLCNITGYVCLLLYLCFVSRSSSTTSVLLRTAL